MSLYSMAVGGRANTQGDDHRALASARFPTLLPPLQGIPAPSFGRGGTFAFSQIND